MSTIAYRNGIVAADMQLNIGDHIEAVLVNKIKKGKAKNGRNMITGAVGEAAIANEFIHWAIDWYSRHDNLAAGPLKEGVTAFIIFQDRQLLLIDDGHIIDTKAPDFIAFGSGRTYATGAMEFGASALSACDVAAKYDPFTGYTNEWLSIND